jgi:FKBP-type peptidyl-prolyl cis-trans isomerase
MSKNTLSALLCLTLCAGSLTLLSGCQDKAAAGGTPEQTAASSKSVSGIQIEDVKVGDGTEAKKGDTVSVNYLGTLQNGQKFDSSYDRNQPFSFKLGSHQVIEGWEKGILGMKEGGKRILTIPPEKAYGPSGYPPVIPGNATLKFEVELVEVQDAE